ncbi:thiamine-phosphate kinase [Thiolapillus sp.]
MAEFQLIERYFSGLSGARQDVALGVGDDCALLQPPSGMQLAMTMDTLIAGRHFLPDTNPRRLGHKVLAVNLSDLAAMGARPAWALLSISLPEIDHAWLAEFSAGFAALAARHDLALVGGDTCQGEMSFSLQLTGFVEAGKELRRDGARPGDRIWVTGFLGDAALALKRLQAAEEPGALSGRLEQPRPRIAEGLALSGAGATSCIDISDGLASDLGHVCRQSGCAARVHLDRLPLSPAMARHVAKTGDYSLALAGGDDYELCFTLPADSTPPAGVDATCIGEMFPGEGVKLVDAGGREVPPPRGWEHFA